MNLSSLFHKFLGVGITSAGIVWSSILHMDAPAVHNMPSPTVQSSVTKDANTITIHKSIEAMGKQVALTLQIPKNGGAIVGTVSGDCNGNITGTYVKANENVDGKGNITCPLGFMDVQATMKFTGKVNPNQKNVAIDYTIQAQNGMSKSGSATVPYTD